MQKRLAKAWGDLAGGGMGRDSCQGSRGLAKANSLHGKSQSALPYESAPLHVVLFVLFVSFVQVMTFIL